MKFIQTDAALPSDALLISNVDDVTSMADALRGARVVALCFPKWTDGRAYSQARLLRSRMRYQGELVATGEVLVDMLPLLQRSGFDAAQLRADQNLAAADRALGFFPGHYQADLVSKLPQFKRVAAASA